MYDPWVLLDRTANLIEVSTFAVTVGYMVYKNRDKLRRRGIPEDIEVQLKPAHLKIHAIELSAVSTGVASMRADVQRRSKQPAPPKPSPAEDLFWWYWRLRFS